MKAIRFSRLAVLFLLASFALAITATAAASPPPDVTFTRTGHFADFGDGWHPGRARSVLDEWDRPAGF